MAAPNNPAVMSVVLRFLRDSRILENVLHVVRADGAALGLTDLSQITNAVVSWWFNTGKNTCPAGITLQDVVATKLDPSDPLQDTALSGVPGVEVTNASPAGTTLSVSAKTGKAGRKFRGRMYWVGLREDAISQADTLSSTKLAAIVSAVAQLNADIAAALPGYLRCIFHRATNTYTPVTQTVADVNVDSQRNRLQQRGI